MGNHKKFWLSDMIPNASNWFYTKLKQIGTKTATTTGGSKRKKKKTHHSGSPSAAHHPLSPHSYPFRKSYHFTRQLTTNKTTPTISPESLLVSTKSTTPTSSSLTATTTTSATTSTSVSAGWNSLSLLPTPPPQVQPSTAYYSTPYKTSLNSINNHDENSSDLDNQRDDLVIHMDSTKSFTEFQTITSRERERRSLPPIKTEHHHGKKLKITTRHTTATASPTSNFRQIRNSILKVVVDEQSLLVTPASSPAGRRRFTTGSSPGVRLRINSPRIARIPLGNYYARRRRSFSSSHNYNSITSKKMTTSAPVLSSESLAIVKSSLDPQRDFMESMVEMIVENGINTANDLEDLLACYLSLNADEYHHLIIKVFQQIWLDLKQRQSS